MRLDLWLKNYIYLEDTLHKKSAYQFSSLKTKSKKDMPEATPQLLKIGYERACL